jgi:hypothetical protein
VGRGRRSVAHYAIGSGGTGACNLHHGPEPVRAIRSCVSVTVPVTVAAAAKHDLLYLIGPGGPGVLYRRHQVASRPQAYCHIRVF